MKLKTLKVSIFSIHLCLTIYSALFSFPIFKNCLGGVVLDFYFWGRSLSRTDFSVDFYFLFFLFIDDIFTIINVQFKTLSYLLFQIWKKVCPGTYLHTKMFFSLFSSLPCIDGPISHTSAATFHSTFTSVFGKRTYYAQSAICSTQIIMELCFDWHCIH